MNDQFEFNFEEGDSSGDGYRRFQQEQAERSRRWASKLGLPVGRKVRVRLQNRPDEITGLLQLASPRPGSKEPRLRVGSSTFTISDIVSVCVAD